MVKEADINFGDTNSKYFYSKITERRHLSYIPSILDMYGVQQNGHDMVAQAFMQYYEHLLGTSTIVFLFPSLLGSKIYSDFIYGLVLPSLILKSSKLSLGLMFIRVQAFMVSPLDSLSTLGALLVLHYVLLSGIFSSLGKCLAK
ncbi:hypothetical protein vseg_007787 [Gypsophila vaccaria]